MQKKKYFQITSRVISEYLGTRVSKEELTVLTFSLFGMCNWIYHWYRPNGPVEPEELSNMICEIFFNGVNKYKR